MQVFFSLTVTAIGISQSSALAPDTNKAKDSTASIFEILDSKPIIDSSSNEGITLETVAGNIELQHVSFNYPTRPHIQIFKDLNLSIPSGKVIFWFYQSVFREYLPIWINSLFKYLWHNYKKKTLMA